MMVREDCVERFQALARELVEKSRAEEGNLSYSLNQNAERPVFHCFIEIWQDQAALDSHNASAHFTNILPQLAEMTSELPQVELFTEVS